MRPLPPFANLLVVPALFFGLLAAYPALASGPVVGWGENYWGQATPPPSVDGTTGSATAIAAGEDHSCAIQAGTGAVVCWGDDSSGQATPPPSVDGTTGTATAIAAGGFELCVGYGSCTAFGHSCAIEAGTGAVVCWGEGPIPPPFVDGTTGTATAIAAGGFHACAINAESGWAFCWGYDGSSAGTVSAIAAGNHHSCAIQAETDAVVCWGADYDGQATPPPSVDGSTGTATAIAAGGSHSCAIQAGTGAVVCWGDDYDGQATPPPSVDGTTGSATAIAAGEDHSCAIQAGTGAVVCWGDDSSGQATPPPSVDGTTGAATAIAAGGGHTLAIRTPECRDGIDNDGDGLIDLDDPECSDADDLLEAPDADGDLVADDLDNCPNLYNLTQSDLDSNGIGDACNDFEDGDGDDWADSLDNCPNLYNPTQSDLDSNGIGDACNNFEDGDGDDWADSLDNCPALSNPNQGDSDGDGLGDQCDNCRYLPNPDQSDFDLDGIGDICDAEPKRHPAGQCRAGQLKAAGKLCGKVLTCHSKYAKKPEKDIGGTKLNLCLQRAGEKFESAYLKAADQAALYGVACDLTEPASAVSSQLSGWIDSIADDCLLGWNSLDKMDNDLRGHLLKAAGAFCGKLLSAERKHQKKFDQGKLGAAQDKRRANFAKTAGKKIESAQRTGFSYDGPSIGDLSDMVEDAAGLISDAVKGK